MEVYLFIVMRPVVEIYVHSMCPMDWAQVASLMKHPAELTFNSFSFFLHRARLDLFLFSFVLI